MSIDAVSEGKATDTQRDPGRWLALSALIVSTLAVLFDGALMGLIAPAVAADLGADAATIGLITSITTLMLAAFILGGGTLGDIYGRKRFLIYGLVGLLFTSVLAMLAPTAVLLIPIRAAAGVMAALVNPLTLAILMVTFDAEERPKALGLYFASIGLIGGFGTIVIQFLNQQFGWRSSFLLVFVLAAIGIFMVSRLAKESKAEGEKRIDWIGILLAAAGLFALIYGINQAAVAGFGSTTVLLPAGVGVVLLVALVMYSRGAQNPALELSLFRKPVFSIGVLIFVMLGFAEMGSFFQLSTYLQSLQQVSPIQAAITLLPMTLALFVFAILAGRWVGRFSNQLLISGGLVMMSVALVMMALLLSPSAGFFIFLVPMVLLGAGYSIANTPRVSIVLASAPPELAGAASATNNAASQIGVSLGIAVMGALFQEIARNAYINQLTQAGLDSAEIARSVEVLSEWLRTNAGDVSAQFGINVQQLQGIITNYQAAYTTGVAQVLLVGAVVTAVGAIMAWFTFKK